MLIEATLLLNHPELVRGLADGTLKRFGGVIRDASSGRIVKHLIEAPGASTALRNLPLPNLIGGPLNLVGQGANVLGHVATLHKLGLVQKTLSSVLQVAQIGTAASVLNLGVSAVGFAYMGYKLNQLDQSVTAMQSRMEAGFTSVDRKLDDVSRQLGYLMLLSESNAAEQRRLQTSLAELHRAVLFSELAELRSWLDQVSRFPGEHTKDAIRAANKTRLVLSDQATRTAPDLDPTTMLWADLAVRGWVVATITEAHLLMGIGKHREARDLLELEHPKFDAVVRSWANALLAAPQKNLATAYRLATPRFEGVILEERLDRIARIHDPDASLSDHDRRRAKKNATIEMEMSRSKILGDDWTRQQIAIADYIDGMSEMSDRMQGLIAFSKECEIRQVDSSRDLLPTKNDAPGIYVLSASQA